MGITFNHRSYNEGDTIKCSLDKASKLGDLAQQLEGVSWPPRLVCRGSELDLSKSLEQQGCQTKDKIFLLNALPNDACKSWARTGRCTVGSRCPHKKSHTKELSPRYVECLHKSGELVGAPSSPSPSTTPPRPSTPEQCSPCIDTRTICRNWSAHGSCRHGDSCRYVYSHVEAAEPLTAGAVAPPSPTEDQWSGSEHSWNGSNEENVGWEGWEEQQGGWGGTSWGTTTTMGQPELAGAASLAREYATTSKYAAEYVPPPRSISCAVLPNNVQ